MTFNPQSREFVVGLFDCCDNCDACCDNVVAPYCMLGMMRYRIQREQRGLDCIGGCLVPFLDGFFFGLCGCVFSGMLRQQVALRYNLSEDSCSFFKGCLCAPCSNKSVQKELYHRGEHAGGLFFQPSGPATSMGMGTPLVAGDNKLASSAGGMPGMPEKTNPYGATHNV